ncbi:nucleotidyltransferase domain-containing protein [Candidatus Woesearchaeota archaeon]|nr:nucleotidyltransferase domain-containing protein [Candidatus Woesearchaeota archaeon]
MLHKKYTENTAFLNESTYKVALLVFRYPNNAFHLRQIARETKCSTTAISEAMRTLESKGIIKIEKTPLTKNIKANLESPEYYFYKKLCNLFFLKQYHVVETLQKIFNNPKTIVLFGSFSRGEDMEKSDIDILIIANDKRTKSHEQTDKTSFAFTEDIYNRKLNLHILPSLEKSSPEFKNTVANGIVLYGYLKVL